MKKVAVIFGGKSTEYEVSLKSARAVIDALDHEKYQILQICITEKGEWRLLSGDYVIDTSSERWLRASTQIQPVISETSKGLYDRDQMEFHVPDLIFPVIHGQQGEDGILQGVLEMMEIPYIGCDITSSAICFNKKLTHQLAGVNGVQATPSITLTKPEFPEAFIDQNGYPVFVKPLRGGSSIGISKAQTKEELISAIEEAFRYDRIITIEKAVEGIEVGCGILEQNGERIIGSVDEIELQSGFFDYHEKYHLEQAEIHQPARVADEVKRQVAEMAERLFVAFGCQDLARIDFFIDRTGAIYLNEINTMPGFTGQSRFPRMFAELGIDYAALIEILLQNHLRSEE
ncbi:D-alanine--D-alanine ligase family protein [Listeria costaricensis]|uniref:D-alanine--D-alanine ligase family protein n=1 Tax=Listeria costaricensis TaxID=2026604 RepID=UPI000C06F927|nr:D-alanine--D-alanine ligase family protein [Listeria costaricensis]